MVSDMMDKAIVNVKVVCILSLYSNTMTTCLYNCFEIESVNLDILLLDRKEKVRGIEQVDLLRVR